MTFKQYGKLLLSPYSPITLHGGVALHKFHDEIECTKSGVNEWKYICGPLLFSMNYFYTIWMTFILCLNVFIPNRRNILRAGDFIDLGEFKPVVTSSSYIYMYIYIFNTCSCIAFLSFPFFLVLFL